ncbi:MAG: hypothetical protein A2268_06565 [Candidatus Raymondbacteria bacterium RifOxyA12_full_50_37]|uniref:Radical SAM core domain-containing protein n=1 Tax=Candidatus Raymondbacteria bacterium RIFOXYD12_FULL_49_13 TaxID=1817890 RepID=A0A1F7EZF2_UNCRA|nr:MAG: hypothetical protein A2350_02395 [Candidatus Raymondbacteria bacterium RifOxyB12_full_50_8]OGJ92189.1 MAG: hypothetical protein A2268_06565 [Candidatus Raymondbacteria bacterium RifOxyA12_full_50_37]OGJ94472.1 MAG: hypothetical protein A2248_15495 [Candidatus Raymondbacteria bacterium RIFOXYA2_FULL_49_16]OGJ99228.1 MAG: hypothetical protein A2453_07345 [Candidatus Raymondbacteria bacterium RIFOXYC2_FULL_50_21]OGJ99764.1 MAG: hypothetical protein A2519_12515 [Candidatus Raymondbacteria b
MAYIQTGLSTVDKLQILSKASQYDLACSCGTTKQEHRTRSQDNQWIYPVTLFNGARTFLLKTLMANTCVNNCLYCPLRVGNDVRRCALSPEAIGSLFLDYYRKRMVSGLFLSSGVDRDPDTTMERLITSARYVRTRGFRGYTHLKIIPGASDGAISEALSLAHSVSLNMEVPGKRHFDQVCKGKDYDMQIIRPLKLLHELTAKGGRFAGKHVTTQFVVGASDETDQELVTYTHGLYQRLGLNRVYFSAYQRGVGHGSMPGEHSINSNSDMLTREHRLYQTDFLLRKYGFSAQEIPFGANGHLSLETDPKELWAQRHPEFFPININKATKLQLLRVPGLGPRTVNTILAVRRNGGRVSSLGLLGRRNKRFAKAEQYLSF